MRDLPDGNDFCLAPGRGWSSCYAVDELAQRSIAAVGVALADLMAAQNLTASPAQVTVDQRLAALWFRYSFRPQGWEMPNLWDPLAGDYRTADGWIRLHTNLRHHRDAALAALDCPADPSAVRNAVAQLSGQTLEQAVVAAGGVAATMRTHADWQVHPQGQAVGAEPLIQFDSPRRIYLRKRSMATRERPLAGLRVLDLTRVLAGPVATRTLAGFGATVLRIDPPNWDEPGVLQDIALGKHMAALDLRTSDGRDRFETLLSETDVLVHGYRPGALDGLGYSKTKLRELVPNLVDVRLNAYGWTGPWAQRRGFDSLVQMSSGIADKGRHWAEGYPSQLNPDAKPVPLPVQALDHATGYLMAAAVLHSLAQATRGEPVADAHLSLARTAKALADLTERQVTGNAARADNLTGAVNSDYEPIQEATSWGPGNRLLPPLSLGTTQMRWDRPAMASDTAEPVWSN
ncbi:CoA transferase [Phaeobacter porticola]|uniref:Putative acyl-CoA transferase/carnitine dehydratase n=1 Tax=Phaeobacter porticola TaxID=1844006 RepID=A0A1L3I7Y2_9RHOB|nr:CoA transferase [Phaeobacter porticola]APG48289.1 putative acyl-CoA transferase/carnitine dehydratase [Phaeobacter porticola]